MTSVPTLKLHTAFEKITGMMCGDEAYLQEAVIEKATESVQESNGKVLCCATCYDALRKQKAPLALQIRLAHALPERPVQLKWRNAW